MYKIKSYAYNYGFAIMFATFLLLIRIGFNTEYTSGMKYVKLQVIIYIPKLFEICFSAHVCVCISYYIYSVHISLQHSSAD